MKLGLDPGEMANYDYEQGQIENAYWNKIKRSTPASSQVKKAKMSEQKLTKIGDAINTGLTPERARVLRLLSKLPREQMAKIFRALTEGGYAME